MKKLLFLATLLIACTTALAEEKIEVEDFNAPLGGQTYLDVRFSFNENHDYVSYQFKVELPEGLSFVTNEYSKVPVVLGDGQPSALYTPDQNTTSSILTCYSNPSTPISVSNGLLIRIPIEVSSSLSLGETLNGKLSGVEFSTSNAVATPFADASFTVTIVENRVVLDETSTVAPTAADGVNVLVKRTINANEWSTICLPFAMTEAQVKAAFGNDVQLADFSSWSSEEDNEGDIISITVGFEDVSSIEANHPYIIRLSTSISDFLVDGVDVDPEEEPTVQVGKKKAEKGFLIGTYKSNTTVPENNLFLSNNKFWYSNGNTKMKAFRAYFEFYDVLTSVGSAGSRINMHFNSDSESTDIRDIMDANQQNRYYDLQGRQVKTPGKGIYVKNGKKVVVK